MPGCCGTPLDHRVKSNAATAVAELWLADARHVESGIRGRGNARASSSTVHMVLRPAVPLRTRATSASVTTDAEFPKLLRMKVEISAIAASLIARHRRHHFGIFAAVDGAGQTMEQRADRVVPVTGHTR